MRHELSQQKLIFDDCVDVLPAHRSVCIEKGIRRRNVQRTENGEYPGKNTSELEQSGEIPWPSRQVLL